MLTSPLAGAAAARVAPPPPVVAFIGLEPDSRHDDIARRFALAGLSCEPTSGADAMATINVLCCRTVQSEALQSVLDRGRRAPIVLLCEAVEDVDRIVALELGADDVFALDQDSREMIARVRALARRVRLTEAQAASGGGRGWVLRSLTRVLVAPDGRLISLTNGEIRAAMVLAEARGQVITRERMIEQLYDGRQINTRSADTLLCRLRKKLDRYSPPLIRTLRGGGYYLDSQVEIA